MRYFKGLSAVIAIGLSLGFWPLANAQATLLDQLEGTAKPDRVSKLKSPIYDQAKQELNEDWYTIYRITERIARANQLDERPWRILVSPEYELNAFANEVNLIAIYSGLLDQLAGDASAIACIVSHEMAHHTLRHQALKPAQRQQRYAEMQAQVQEEVEAEIKDAEGDAQGARIGASVLNVFGIGVGGRALEQSAQDREARAEERVQEIFAQRQAEFDADLLKQNRVREYQADIQGYEYMARAGFEADGCLRSMDVLNQTTAAEFDSTHPAVPKRIEALETVMESNPPEALKAEGRQNLAGTPPLTYDLSKDGESLRINSERGGSTADDLDRLFGP